jgi:hypothetical protein
MYFVCGSFDNVGYLKQVALLDETVISSACIDKHQQLKVSVSY